MARRETEENVTQSILERLTDLDPSSRTDPPQTRAQSVRQLKSALRRDLAATEENFPHDVMELLALVDARARPRIDDLGERLGEAFLEG